MSYVQQAQALARTRENVLSQLNFRLERAKQAIELAKARREESAKVDASGTFFGMVKLGISGLSLTRLLHKNAVTAADMAQLVYVLQRSIAEIRALSFNDLNALAASADQADAPERKRQFAQQAINGVFAKMSSITENLDLDMPAPVGYNNSNFGR